MKSKQKEVMMMLCGKEINICYGHTVAQISACSTALPLHLSQLQLNIIHSDYSFPNCSDYLGWDVIML